MGFSSVNSMSELGELPCRRIEAGRTGAVGTLAEAQRYGRLANFGRNCMPLFVKTVYSVKEAQREMAQLVRTAESGRMATITRHDKTVAYVIGAEEMSALLETMEIMSDPKAMQAIRDAEAGVGRDQMIDLEDLPD